MLPIRFLARFVLFGLVFLSACSRADSPASRRDSAGSSWDVSVRPVPLAVAAGSSEPQLTTWPGGVVASWVEKHGDMAVLRFAERRASGWSDVRTAASGGDWFLSWADVPAVMRMSDGTLVAQWLKAVDPLIEAYDLRLSYSRDDGRTWSAPFSPHHDGTRTQHGFASLIEMPGQGLGLVWLDGRQAELDTTSPDGGAMSVRFAAFDRTWTQTADMEVDGRVCECCPTSAAITPDGVVTVFRDRSLREIRDVHLSRFENGAWTAPTPVHVDDWKIEACPVNGPALAARGRQLAAAWFTARDDRPRAFLAFSPDAGRSWSEPVRLDDAATLGHVAVALLEDGSAAAAWVEFADGRGALRMRRVAASGARSTSVALTAADRRITGIPRLARIGDALVIAWTEAATGESPGGTVRVAEARVAAGGR